MALFDDITKKAAKLTEGAIDKTSELAGIAKIKLKIKNLESDREEVFAELGKHYFQLIKDDENIDSMIAELKQKIFDYDHDIEELEKSLDE